MRFYRIVSCSLIILSLLGSIAQADDHSSTPEKKPKPTQPPPPPPPPPVGPIGPDSGGPSKTAAASKAAHKVGSVTAVDAQANTITVKDTYQIGENTKVTSKGKSITLADIKVGDTVRVLYTKEGDKLFAVKISVASDYKSAKHK